MRTGYSALLLVLSLLTGFSHATTWYVDAATEEFRQTGTSMYPRKDIQPAIDHAGDGDTIIVAPGRYISPDPWAYGELNFKGKSIRLVSSAPTDFSVAEQTILCGVVIFDGSEDPNCLLQGFKIQNHTCGGILGNDTQASVSHCIISGNGPCGATVVKDMRGELRNCLIVDNATFHGCAVQPVVSGCKFIFNCTIGNNISGVGIEGALSSVLTRIHNCIIYGNQGEQIIPSGPVLPKTFSPRWMADMRYSLVPGLTDSDTHSSWSATNFDGDPCFVQPGYWVGDVLVEGDYHLKSEGWRWSEQEIHGSHWYFDSSTSCAIDAGDPLVGLGEELERAPGDPEGRWGVNHAINLGAYGGTNQASLAPNRGRPLGVAGVDFSDYWPFAMGSMWSLVDPQNWSTLEITVVGYRSGNYPCQVYTVREKSGSTSRDTYWAYIDGTLYVTGDANARDLLPQISEKVQAQYPQYLTIGSTIDAPFDPFELTTRALRSTIVTRGTLEDMLAGTDFEPGQFVMGPWPDVIALRESAGAGAPGQLVAMFARGFGPLMLAGQPVEYATVNGRDFTTSAREEWVPSGRIR